MFPKPFCVHSNDTLDYLRVIAEVRRNCIFADTYKPSAFNLANPADAWMNIAAAAAVAQRKHFVAPPYPVRMETTFRCKTGINYYFPQGSQLIKVPPTTEDGLKASYRMLDLDNYQNGYVINPNLRGDADSAERAGRDPGEKGMCIQVTRANNIAIWNAHCEYPCGDGIYLAQASTNVISDNVRIYNAYINKADRDAISITSGKNTLIKGGVLKASFNNPAAGVNIEPNPDHIVTNVWMENIITQSNNWAAYQFGLGHFYKTPGNKNLGEVVVKNCTDYSSGYGLWFSFFSTAYLDSRYVGYFPVNVHGNITVENFKMVGAREMYIRNAVYANDPMLTVKLINLSVENLNGNGVPLTESAIRNAFEKPMGALTPRPIVIFN